MNLGFSKVIAAVVIFSLPFMANAAALEPLVNLNVIESFYKSDSVDSGRATLLSIGVLVESESGSFHKLGYSKSVTGRSDSSSSDDFEDVSYRLGKSWYPRFSGKDFSIFSGLGLATNEEDNAQHREVRILYFPIGFEGGIPLSNPKNYFTYGAEASWVINSTQAINRVTTNKDVGGFGYSLWLGMDFRLGRTTSLETRLMAKGWDIDNSAYELQSYEVSLGLRF